MMELTANEFWNFYNMLPKPELVESGKVRGIGDNPKEITISQRCGNKDIFLTFKLAHISKHVVEWRPKESVVINNSDVENFCEEEYTLIS